MYLNTHSYFSFKYGVMSPQVLLEEAARRGVQTLALTDINYSGGCQDFVRLAPQYNIRPVVGVDFRNKNNEQIFVALAENNTGFREINDYLSHHLHHKLSIPARKPEFENVQLIYPFRNYQGEALDNHEWVGVNYTDIHRIPFNKYEVRRDRLVILHTATFRNKRDFNAHRLLRAIDSNTLLSKLPKSQEGKEGDILLAPSGYKERYGMYDEAIRNTVALLEKCEIDFLFSSDGALKNQRFYTGSSEDDFQKVKQLCEEGLRYRYTKLTTKIHNRLEKELMTIRERGFLSYFLINWRIVQYARQRGYFYVGRGSGANSIIAYLLRITDVDPIELDLYFERFINLYRKNPPDFDIDFSWRDREDITQFIFNEFDNVALLGTYNTFKHKAVLRELGKVFGLPNRDIEKLQISDTPDSELDTLSQLVRKYSGLIQGAPSHLGIHAGGILISEESIHCHSATEMPPKGFPTVQFDMVVAEDIGLHKFDILSQRGLGKIKDCIAIVKENKPDEKSIDIHNINAFVEDKKVKSLLRNGRAIGCFYVESPAMRMLLKKLRVDHYLGLVAASSVIRPGVAKSGMMREYILRFRYPERRKKAHPILQDIMPETYGVMVYQEDVIKVAHYFAGLTLGEADVLRRGMSGKYRSREEFQCVKDKFFSNCQERGYDPKNTQAIWLQIESFAGYAFAKGHSASYAVESYQSLYLKAYYPLEYVTAILNNGGGFYSYELYVHEARMHGARIEAPCVNRSEVLAHIAGVTIYLGLNVLKEMGAKAIEKILTARIQEGVFEDLYDCIYRTGISLEQVKILIRIGAFRFTGKSKKALLWEAHFLLGNKNGKKRAAELFNVRPKRFSLPAFSTEVLEDAFDEMELLGFPLSSPFRMVRKPIPRHVMAAEMKQYTNKVITTYGYLVSIKRTRTSGGKRMYFGTFVDRRGAFLDTVHFPPVARAYPFRGKGVYKLIGKIVEEFEFYTIEIIRMYKEPYVDDPRYVDRPLPNTA